MAHDAGSPTERDPSLIGWLNEAIARGASDLHLVDSHPPVIRLHGQLESLAAPPLNRTALAASLRSLCSPVEWDHFQSQKNIDFACEHASPGVRRRLRVNLFLTGPSVGACIRIIPDQIPDFAWAGFPRDLAVRMAHFRNGLVLFAGVAGAGKSTSLAMLTQLLNEEGGHRIITIEDPVEYVFPRIERSVISQREVGRDVRTFADGLKFGLRQDPDVFLVGEIRDRDTAQLALSAAETGHLVFSTVHARDAKGAVSRFCDLFPQPSQFEVRAQLALALRAVVCQHLLPGILAGDKRELALEVLFVTSGVASAIRLGKIEAIDTSITTGRAEGMISLAESIKRLLVEGRIYPETAEHFAGDAIVGRRR
ncbi:MAG: type IV pilus twitching motility protein PilT [Pirellulaceae bacterium]